MFAHSSCDVLVFPTTNLPLRFVVLGDQMPVAKSWTSFATRKPLPHPLDDVVDGRAGLRVRRVEVGPPDKALLVCVGERLASHRPDLVDGAEVVLTEERARGRV